MTFGTDQQTILDLNIFPKNKNELSVFDVYNYTRTNGGKEVLEDMFLNPLNNEADIRSRISNINFFNHHELNFEFDKDYLAFIELYLNQNTPVLKDNNIDSLIDWISYLYKPNNAYFLTKRGISYIRDHLILLSKIIDQVSEFSLPENLEKLFFEIKNVLQQKEFRGLLKTKKLKFWQINHFDSIIRNNNKDTIEMFLNITYKLDVFSSFKKLIENKNYSLPAIVESSYPVVKLKGFIHPLLKSPVVNDLEFANNQNMCFVTGANMSGKSTFLKSVALCMYLAHMGLPVPAKSMELSVFNGLYSTINISDDISKGYSHFYSEVNRVKEILLKIKEKEKLIIIFDELFRGTNVKDAFDASYMVTEGFTKLKNSLFFISTHLVEVGEELVENKSVAFKCFKSFLKNNKPEYDYKIEDGISSERLGLSILKNENVLDLLDEIIINNKELHQND